MTTDFFDFENCSPAADIFCQVSSWMRLIVPVLILIFGLFGNTISISILLRKKVRSQATFVFFLFLSIFDCISLLVMVLHNYREIVFGYYWNVFARIFCILIKILHTISVYVLGMIAIERVIFIWRPLQAQQIVTNKKRIGVFCTTVLIIVVANVSTAIGVGARVEVQPLAVSFSNTSEISQNSTKGDNSSSVDQAVCFTTSESYGPSKKYVQYGMFALNHVIPLGGIIIGNILIVTKMVSQKIRTARFSQSSSRTSKMLTSSTRTSLVVTAYYCCTTFPIFAVRFMTMKFIGRSEGFTHIKLIENILFLVMLCGHAGNFIIYFSNGSLFREQSKLMLQGVKQWKMWTICKRCRTDEVPSK